ncbi:MAG: hypothetical protein KAI18_00655 [Candidatus Aenigmarchaeota archaeon]|nr:hypothetical protein [Candidatus Aenigmarchaeota archaeon]
MADDGNIGTNGFDPKIIEDYERLSKLNPEEITVDDLKKLQEDTADYLITTIGSGIEELKNSTKEILNSIDFEIWGFNPDILDYIEKEKEDKNSYIVLGSREYPYKEIPDIRNDSKEYAVSIPVLKDVKSKDVIEQLTHNLSEKDPTLKTKDRAYNIFETIFDVDGIIIRYNEQLYTDKTPFFKIEQPKDVNDSDLYNHKLGKIANELYQVLDSMGYLRTDDDRASDKRC